MSNYSKQESAKNFELVSKISENNSGIIGDIEVKIKPQFLRTFNHYGLKSKD